MTKNPSSKRIIFWWKIQGSGWSDPKSIDTHLDQIWPDLQQPNLTSKKNHLSHSFFTLLANTVMVHMIRNLCMICSLHIFEPKNVKINWELSFSDPLHLTSVILRSHWMLSIPKPTTVIGCKRLFLRFLFSNMQVNRMISTSQYTTVHRRVDPIVNPNCILTLWRHNFVWWRV